MWTTQRSAGRTWAILPVMLAALAWAPSIGVNSPRVLRGPLLDTSESAGPAGILDSLASADSTLQAGATDLPALFNYAYSVQALGARELATAVWRDYLNLANDQTRIAAYRQQRFARWPRDLRSQWLAALPTLHRGTAPALVRRFPEQARRWGEGVLLTNWAEALSHGNVGLANNNLDNARLIGAALRESSHETLLAESVEAIDGAVASGDAQKTRALIDAHLAYRAGRILFASQDYGRAMPELENARAGFAAGASPMASVASFFIAGCTFAGNQTDAALSMLAAQAGAERRSPGHRALLAQELWYLANCQGTIGRWSDSIDSADEALRIFQSLGEIGYCSALQILLAEDLAFIGDHVRSRQCALDAIRNASLAGDRDRLLVALGSASAAELRRQQWQSARALAALELRLAGTNSPPELVTTSLARLAVCEYKLRHIAVADSVIERAHAVAQRVSDQAMRRKLIGDITALHAAMLRERNPRRAVQLLTSSIGFHEQVNKAFALPELYLERGRCKLALREERAALSDFERGIEELETQRTTMFDANLRGGMFDDSRALFTETIALLLSRGDAAGAFRYAERGRARALLDQFGKAGTDGAAPYANEAEVRATLPEGTLLIEYATLSDRLVIFAADRERLSVATVPIAAAELGRATTALLRAASSGAPPREIRTLSANLYATLLQPVETRIASARRLVIVPDGVLQRMPFSMLIDPRTDSYLIERVEVAKEPSASVFINAAREYRLRAVAPPRSAAIIADPITSLPELAATRREGRTIAALYPRHALLMREEATAPNFIAGTASADVIHYGGHAVVDNVDPLRSALMLTGNRFDARAITACSFPRTRVVVLAACSTIVGPTTTTEGAASIARAFIAGGVPSVVGTLWDVNDATASRIACDLHSSLARGDDPAAALRHALCGAIRSSDPSLRDPSAWCAFEVIGAPGR